MNRLADETSPYLRQHADNPVDWFPWGPEAFELARSTDRPVLLSVGYSACHWCHVMAHESFEDPEIAALMNRLFVCVKVDREERPDVDAIYMEATQAMTGSGGWPMTVFMDADGAPFYCGTYFPPTSRRGMPGFTQLCTAIDDAWQHRRGDLAEQAAKLTEYLRREPKLAEASAHPGLEALDRAEAALLKLFDPRWGGFGTAPKFPQSMAIDLLLRQARRTGSTAALEAATRSLDAMAAGGIHDHLGGGFARYSVDEQWAIPHFEKMLYDNALLIRPYLHAWQLTGNAAYRRVVDDIVGYLLRDLRSPRGGFHSAEDADSLDAHGHSEEGAFYVWSLDELTEVLTTALGADAAEEFVEHYDVTRSGNFDGSNQLHRPVGGFDVVDDEAQRERLDAARSALLAHRSATRARPGLDDKVLTEWNGLLLASLAEAASATGNATWLAAAVEQAEFLCAELRRPDGRWLRSWQAEGGARHLAFAHDHATLVDGFTRLYEATGEQRWLTEARSVAEALLDLFWDDASAGFFTTGHDAEPLLTRPKDLMDNATPSANSTATTALLRLAALTSADDPAAERFRDAAHRILAALGHVAGDNPMAFGNLLLAVELADDLAEVVIVGDRPDLVEVVREEWRPEMVLAAGEPGTGSLWADRRDGAAYVCHGHVCLAPTDTPEGLRAQLAR
ncbi:MAG: thioredoxin domain-containing protein [Acidimicrobiales bacterium]